jgi:hypothetical protein
LPLLLLLLPLLPLLPLLLLPLLLLLVLLTHQQSEDEDEVEHHCAPEGGCVGHVRARDAIQHLQSFCSMRRVVLKQEEGIAQWWFTNIGDVLGDRLAV